MTVIDLIQFITNLFVGIIFISAILSFFLPPYHSLREALDRILDPFLNPIRSMIPMAGMVDFSPMILIVAVELLSRVLISFLLLR